MPAMRMPGRSAAMAVMAVVVALSLSCGRDDPIAPRTSTTTPTATQPVANPTAPPPLATPTATEPPTSPTAEMALDGDGWPLLQCPSGSAAVKAPARRVTACSPAGIHYMLTNHEYDGVGPDLNGERLWVLTFNELDAGGRPTGHFVGLQVINRATSRATRENYQQSPCPLLTKATLLGYPAERCTVLSEIGYNQWGLELFVETPEFWVIANAAGRQTGEAQAEALQRALDVFASARANGLETVE